VAQVCQESIGATTQAANTKCSDGVDNDGDSFVDCLDWDCSHNPLVTNCPTPRVCE
jgi:hypothetical protein